MKKKPVITLYSLLALMLTVIILIYPGQCLIFALNGLNLWFQKMIPTLFPFMVLSGIIIRLNLTETFVKILKPLFTPIFKVSPAGIYVICIGFLCGFPMGAHVIGELYERNELDQNEAAYLLSFCNNIGPVYFLSFVIPSLKIKSMIPCLFGMYGLPLLYGILLRHTVYKYKIPYNTRIYLPARQAPSLLNALDESVTGALIGIARLGGYMIVFNLLNIIPCLFTDNMFIRSVFNCLSEITGGIRSLGSSAPLFVLCVLPFGGLSCIAQTYSMVKNTNLSIASYTMHKIILTAITVVFYFFLTVLSF